MRSIIRTLFLGVVPLVCAVGLVALAAQVETAPDFRRPIVEQLEPGQQYLLLQRVMSSHPRERGDTSFVTALVESNPVIFTGRVLRKQPAFIDVWNSRGPFTVVPLAEATWIGSRLTVLIERVIQTVEELPLREGDGFAFVWPHYGSATINGARVDAETLSVWPIDEGKRYLVVGRLMELGGSSEKGLVAGMWLEPSDGAPLRGPGRTRLTPLLRGPAPTAPAPDASAVYEANPTFEQDGLVATDIYAVTRRLEEEVAKRKASSPR